MEICQTQPHLVSPMRLVLYDNLPSPTSPPPIPRPASSLPSRILADGKQLASRASSIRDSISLRPKSVINRNRISISGPSDFRRVHSSVLTDFQEEMMHSPAQQRQQRQFRPLQLSIYDAPGHQLPDLPSFEKFRLDDEEEEGEEGEGNVLVKQPERAFSLASSPPPSEFVLSHRSSASFHLPRKPVGSGARRASSVQGQQPQHHRQPSFTPPTGTACPLIPHFARVSQLNPTGGKTLRSASMPGHVMGMPGCEASSKIAGCDLNILQDGSVPFAEPLEEKLPSPLPPLAPATPTKSTASTASTMTAATTPPLPDTKFSPVTQWLFSKSSNNSININNMRFPSPPSSPFKSHFRSRSRTLSGSTLSSQPNQAAVTTTANPQISKHSHCLSTDSHKTMTEPVPSPLSHAISANTTKIHSMDKGVTADTSIISKPCAAAVNDERMAYHHPTIYEGEQMQGTFI